jgi:hypothetical protein
MLLSPWVERRLSMEEGALRFVLPESIQRTEKAFRNLPGLRMHQWRKELRRSHTPTPCTRSGIPSPCPPCGPSPRNSRAGPWRLPQTEPSMSRCRRRKPSPQIRPLTGWTHRTLLLAAPSIPDPSNRSACGELASATPKTSPARPASDTTVPSPLAVSELVGEGAQSYRDGTALAWWHTESPVRANHGRYCQGQATSLTRRSRS